MSTFQTLDSRKRINLATIATRESYRVTREVSGRIILDPAVVLTEDELAVLNDETTRKAVATARSTRETVPRRRL